MAMRHPATSAATRRTPTARTLHARTRTARGARSTPASASARPAALKQIAVSGFIGTSPGKADMSHTVCVVQPASVSGPSSAARNPAAIVARPRSRDAAGAVSDRSVSTRPTLQPVTHTD